MANNASDYDAAADAYKAAKGDKSKLTREEREKVNRLTNETSARGNKVREARDHHR